jgi:hypothetical protein
MGYLIALVIVIALIYYYPWIIPVFIAGVVAVVLVQRKIKKSLRKKNRPYSRPPDTEIIFTTGTPVNITQMQADNDIRIMQDCLSLINTSQNMETVVVRYNDLLNVLTRMSTYENKPNIKHLKERPSEALIRMHDEQADIMNRAVDRSYEHELDSASQLKTEKGRSNRIERYFAVLEELSSKLPQETLRYIEFLKSGKEMDLSAENSESATPQNHTNIFEFKEKPLQADYFNSIRSFANARGDEEKISELEKSLPSFKSFVSYSFKNGGELPPGVPYRDTLPELYMRRGDWAKAEQVIRLCISIGAYGYTDYSKNQEGIWVSDSENGEDQLSMLQERGDASVAALQYLSRNPGTLQKDIYKIPELSSCDRDALMWFCRSSHQIRKEKEGKTNRLYLSLDDNRKVE